MTTEHKPQNIPDAAESLIRARNHIDSARWEIERAHPILDPEEPCLHYEVWAALGKVRELLDD